MVRICTAEALPGYRLRLGLTDGRTVERDLRHLVPATADPDNVFTPWRDPTYFAQVRLADYGTVVWPNGADLDPDVLIWDGPPPEMDTQPPAQERVKITRDLRVRPRS